MGKRKLLILFAWLLALSIQAAHFNEGFEDISLTDADGNPLTSSFAYGYGLSNGWRVIGGRIYASPGVADYGITSKAHTGEKALEASYGSKNEAFILIPTTLMGDFTFWARRTSTKSKGSVSIIEVEPDGDGYKTKAVLETVNPSSTSWEQHTVHLGTGPRLVAINMVRASIDDVEYDFYEEPTTPLMELRMGEQKVERLSFDFGLSEKDSLLSFTLANVGQGTLEASLTTTGGYEATPASLSVEGGMALPFALRQPANVPGPMQGTLAITAPDLDTITLELRGIIRDPQKLYLDFNTLPQGWTLNEYGSLADSTLHATSWNNALLTSPVIEVAENEELYLRYRRATEVDYQKPSLTIAYTDDDANWTQLEGDFAADALFDEWSHAHILGIPSTARRIRLSLRYVAIDDFYGFAQPKKAIMKVEAAHTDFGMIAADTACTFLVRNEGTAVLNSLQATSTDSHFTVSLPESIAPGDSAVATLTMAAMGKGRCSTLITVSAQGQEPVSFPAEGYVVDQEAIWLPLHDSLPAGWENQGWQFGHECAYADHGGQQPVSILSPRLIIADNDSLVFRAAREYESGWIRFSLSSDHGKTWQPVKEYGAKLSDTARTFSLTDVPAGDFMLRIDGNYAYLYALNGFHVKNQAPIISVTRDGQPVADGFADNFGILYKPDSHAYVVRTSGTGNLRLRIRSSQDKIFTVSDSTLSLPADSVATILIAPVFDDIFATKSATIMFSSMIEDGTLPLSIVASAQTRDSTKFRDDFENGFSSLWTNKGWEIEVPYYGNGTQMASATSADSTMLVSPRLKALMGDSILFEAMLPWAGDPLMVEYSTDEQATWQTDSVYSSDQDHTYLYLRFVAPQDGCYFLRFCGKYSCLDNFYGFTYQQEPPVIDDIRSNPAIQQGDDAVYDLMGRKMNPHSLKPGIYIRNGKKFKVGSKN